MKELAVMVALSPLVLFGGWPGAAVYLVLCLAVTASDIHAERHQLRRVRAVLEEDEE